MQGKLAEVMKGVFDGNDTVNIVWKEIFNCGATAKKEETDYDTDQGITTLIFFMTKYTLISHQSPRSNSQTHLKAGRGS